MADNVPANPTLTIDSLSVLLLSSIIITSLYHLVTSTRSQPLVHPILLGRQSEWEKVRRKGESAVVKNQAVIVSGLVASPKHSIRTVSDLLNESTGSLTHLTLPNGSTTGGEELKQLVAQARAALVARAPELLETEGGGPRVLLALHDAYLDTIFTLAVATLPHPSLHLSLPSSLPTSLSPSFQTAVRSHGSRLVLALTDSSALAPALSDVLKPGTPVVAGDAVESLLSSAQLSGAPVSLPQPAEPEVSKHLVGRTVVFSLAETSVAKGASECSATLLTHQNLTAGVAATLGVFSALSKMEARDKVGVVSSPHGVVSRGDGGNVDFGIRLPLLAAAAYTGAGSAVFNDLPSVAKWNPTALLLDGATVAALANKLREKVTKRGYLARRDFSQRVIAVTEGGTFPKSPIPGVSSLVGSSLRAILVTGTVSQVDADHLRALLCCTVQRLCSSPFAFGPLLSPHAYDFQSLQGQGPAAHVGPPVVNVEAKVVGMDEASVQAGLALKGQLAVRGPSVASTVVTDEGRAAQCFVDQSFVVIGQEVELLPNGTFKVVDPPAREG